MLTIPYYLSYLDVLPERYRGFSITVILSLTIFRLCLAWGNCLAFKFLLSSTWVVCRVLYARGRSISVTVIVFCSVSCLSAPNPGKNLMVKRDHSLFFSKRLRQSRGHKRKKPVNIAANRLFKRVTYNLSGLVNNVKPLRV